MKNTRLITVAQDILHLYETPHFRSLARGNWDAVQGFKRVELENIVQTNEDRILDQKYCPGEQPPPAAPHDPAAAPAASTAAAPASGAPIRLAPPPASNAAPPATPKRATP